MRKVTLGTSLFCPSTMPASYQPVSTSVSRRSFSTSRARQPPATRAASTGAITSVRLRILTQYDTATRREVPDAAARRAARLLLADLDA
ncbi:hypothetical protein D3C83_22580 [compost metagenome]